jgi:hypothetical protein
VRFGSGTAGIAAHYAQQQLLVGRKSALGVPLHALMTDVKDHPKLPPVLPEHYHPL